MSEAQDLAERIVRTMLERDAFSRWLGVELVEVSVDRAAVKMTVREEMLNGFGVCHGGVTFSLADSALAFASNTHGRVSVSIENSISYPAKVVAGDTLTAIAEEQSSGARIAIYQVIVTKNGGAKVGLFRGTVYRTDQEFFGDRD